MAIAYHLTIETIVTKDSDPTFQLLYKSWIFSLDLNVSLAVSQGQCSAWIFFFTFDIEAMP